MSVGHHIPAKNYFINFVVLMVLMFLTVYVARHDFGAFNLPVALAIAITKTTCIILFFMNVRYGTQLTWVFAAGGFFWLLIMIGFTMSDFYHPLVELGTPTTTPIP